MEEKSNYIYILIIEDYSLELNIFNRNGRDV